jgi:hypothetical protein
MPRRAFCLPLPIGTLFQAPSLEVSDWLVKYCSIGNQLHPCDKFVCECKREKFCYRRNFLEFRGKLEEMSD